MRCGLHGVDLKNNQDELGCLSMCNTVRGFYLAVFTLELGFSPFYLSITFS